MTVDYEPAPKPSPLWLLPLTIAVLALVLLWAVQQFTEREIGGFGGRAQPATPMPDTLAGGTPLPEVPEELSGRFGDDVVLAQRLDEIPDPVERRCRRSYARSDDPARQRLGDLVASSDVAVAHLGPDALTYLSIAVDNAPPGYPREVQIACIARPLADGWQMPRRPLLDFALDGRPGITLPSAEDELPGPAETATDEADGSSEGTGSAAPSASPTESVASEATTRRVELPAVRTRLVQVPVGAQWAVQWRGGWWLAHDVNEVSWTLLPVNDVMTERDPLRVVFIDATGGVVADRGVGPTRAAAQADHGTDYELVAGGVREILDKLSRRPVRICEPGNRTLCVWLTLNEFDEVLAFGAYGPHPLDTPPLGYVGYCPKAGQFQGSVTSTRFNPDGTWAGGPVDRGLDRYTVRFEADMVVVDLSEHVTGAPAEGDPATDKADCEFTGTRARGEPKQ
jgi:hypothetical protein